MYTRKRMLREYQAELSDAFKMKANGVTMVEAVIAGTDSDITIDEYIAIWKDGIYDVVNNDADPEQYNY